MIVSYRQMQYHISIKSSVIHSSRTEVFSPAVSSNNSAQIPYKDAILPV